MVIYSPVVDGVYRGSTSREMERCLDNGQFNREALWNNESGEHFFLHDLDLLGMGMMSGLGLVVTAGANFVQTAVKPLSG